MLINIGPSQVAVPPRNTHRLSTGSTLFGLPLGSTEQQLCADCANQCSLGIVQEQSEQDADQTPETHRNY